MISRVQGQAISAAVTFLSLGRNALGKLGLPLSLLETSCICHSKEREKFSFLLVFSKVSTCLLMWTSFDIEAEKLPRNAIIKVHQIVSIVKMLSTLLKQNLPMSEKSQTLSAAGLNFPS